MDLGRKRDIYAREGVDHLWFVDPDVKMLEAFELRECKWVLLATLVGDAPVSLPPVRRHHFPAWCALAGDSLKGMPGWSRKKMGMTTGSFISSHRNCRRFLAAMQHYAISNALSCNIKCCTSLWNGAMIYTPFQ